MVEDGDPGEDGVAREYVFARTNSASLPNAQRPSNSWGYDNPQSIGGLQWHDGSPGLTSDLPYLWRAERVSWRVGRRLIPRSLLCGRISQSLAGLVLKGSRDLTRLTGGRMVGGWPWPGVRIRRDQ